MLPEVTGSRPGPSPRHGWWAWPLLVLSALPLLTTAVVTRRVLGGTSTVYGGLPGGLPLRERVALLLTFSTNELAFALPLLGLLCLLWLASSSSRRVPAAALWAGAGVAAVVGAMALGQCVLVGYLSASEPASGDDVSFLGPDASLLELFATRVALSLLLAGLSAGLAVALASRARGPASLHDEPQQEPEPEPDEADREPDGELDAVPTADSDPHERYRRTS